MGAQPGGRSPAGGTRRAGGRRAPSPARPAGGWLAVRGASLEMVGTTAAENGIAVFELYRPRQSLESVFLELTGGTEAGS